MRTARKPASKPGRETPSTGPRSYRESHLGPEKARSYDEDLWDSTTAKGLDWLVEQQLLAKIIATQIPPEARSAADFACGTGRVLEFIGRRFPHPVGIDISPDMLALARNRCPEASFVTGDVTSAPDLAPGPFDLITAFRFFLNAEPKLRDEVMAWMRDALDPGGLAIVNFHLNPLSLRGIYLRLRMRRPSRPSMMTVGQARRLFRAHGFSVRQMAGYSFLPYRRDGRHQLAPGARQAVETRLAGRAALLPLAGSFLLVASREPSGQAR
jgi:SAM-dependent methyltransferase